MTKDEMLDFTPFGTEWENEMKKLPKEEIIKMLRKEKTGAEDKKLLMVRTAKDACLWVEGIINDFESGIFSKSETLNELGKYTGRIMGIFFDNAKQKFIDKQLTR